MSASPPTFFVQITDPHLRDDDASRLGHLAAAVNSVLALGVRPAGVIVTGDIADQGKTVEYLEAMRELARIDAPKIVVPGNKDDRAAMRAAFGIPGESTARVQTSEIHSGIRILACDTQIPGEFSGDLDVDWLADTLAADRSTPTIIAMHHPPYRVGITALDAIGLPAEQRAALDALLADAPNVLRVIAGHVHRASFGSIGGVPATTASSVSFQLALDLDGPDTMGFAPHEPAAIALHVLVDGDLVTHVHPVDPAA